MVRSDVPDRDLEGLLLLGGNAQIEGQQIGGALGNDAERDAGLGQTVGHHPYGPVAPGDDDQIDSFGDRLADPRAALVLGLGLQPLTSSYPWSSNTCSAALRNVSLTLTGLKMTAQRPPSLLTTSSWHR